MAEKVKCFVCKQECDVIFFSDGASDLSNFEKHLINSHQVIIPKFNCLTDLNQFCSEIDSLDSWEQTDRLSKFVMSRFEKHKVYHIIDKTRIDENSQKDDSYIKNLIQNDFLEKILADVQDERSCVTFSRMCLLCRKEFTNTNRSTLLDHLHQDHNLFLGHPDNIIDTNEFLDLLEEKLKALQCLYCEKTFKSWNVMKEHMRKKGHKSLNPTNREYDRFYLINYLSCYKHWQQVKMENDFYIDKCDEEWKDWTGDDHQECLCFFCPYRSKIDAMKKHLIDSHEFDFNRILSLEDFYDRIRFVNFLRKRTNNQQCFACDLECTNYEELIIHFTLSGHFKQDPKRAAYTDPEYYFPTLDDDAFLFCLDDLNDI